jgi:hypothetical protein
VIELMTLLVVRKAGVRSARRQQSSGDRFGATAAAAHYYV